MAEPIDEDGIEVRDDSSVGINQEFCFCESQHSLNHRSNPSTMPTRPIMAMTCRSLHATRLQILQGKLTGINSEESTRSVTSSIYDYERSHGRTYHAVCCKTHPESRTDDPDQ